MVRVTIDAGIATITLQRPARLNALTWTGMDRVRSAITDLAARADVRVLVFTGSGRGFCSGLDLTVLDGQDDLPTAVPVAMTEHLNPLCQAIAEAPIPVVAAVNGPCAGGGLALALLADITLAAASSYFLVPQVGALGIVPDAGATWVLPRLVGRARALGMALTGARVHAPQAEQWGLIWRCVPDRELMPQTYALAAELAEVGTTIVATRQLIDSATSMHLDQQLAAETHAQANALGDRGGKLRSPTRRVAERGGWEPR